ncbi:MAG: hypothetical protein N2C13_02260 [Chloroflexota bacterium]
MSSTLDALVLPIYRQDGYDQSYLPGLEVAEPPRRAARGRRNDRLIIFFSLEGGSQISPSQHSQVIESLVKTYFKTSGTATTAMRAVVESLNDYLFKRNRTTSARGRHTIALLTLMVIREDSIYIAQCGPVHGLLLSKTGIRHLHDKNAAGPGLGTSRDPQVKFHQADFHAGDMLITTPSIPEGWNETTFHAGFDGNIPAFRRRLLADGGTDLTSVIVVGQEGTGQLELIGSPEAIDRTIAPLNKPAAPKTEPTAAPLAAPTQIEQPTPVREPQSASFEQTSKIAVEPSYQTDESEELDQALPEYDQQESTARFDPKSLELGAKLNDAVSAISIGAKNLFGNISGFVGRMLPEDTDLHLPSSTMAIIAIAVPVVVVAIAGIFYFQIGKQAQYDFNFGTAMNVADTIARNESSSPNELKVAWEVVLYWVDEAERYEVTDESQALRAKTVLILDEIAGVTRLEFEPAILGSVGASVEITNMVATGTDLYMLDGDSGNVLHAIITGSGQYVLDTEYRCGPGQYAGVIVIELIDIAALPRPTQDGATIVAIDSNGILLYCSNTGSPTASALTPPDNNWGSPKAISIANGNLYVLDPLVNAVWIYFGDNYEFTEPPRFFFAEQVPSMQSSVDIELDGDDLYLLQADGSMITCTLSEIPEAPTTCEEPAQYSASPSGDVASPVPGDFTFSQMAHTAPPEPSIFLLDTARQTVYHFSLRLNLAAQYRSTEPFPSGSAGAFTVSPNRAIFIAFRNQVYVTFIR